MLSNGQVWGLAYLVAIPTSVMKVSWLQTGVNKSYETAGGSFSGYSTTTWTEFCQFSKNGIHRGYLSEQQTLRNIFKNQQYLKGLPHDSF